MVIAAKGLRTPQVPAHTRTESVVVLLFVILAASGCAKPDDTRSPENAKATVPQSATIEPVEHGAVSPPSTIPEPFHGIWASTEDACQLIQQRASNLRSPSPPARSGMWSTRPSAHSAGSFPPLRQNWWRNSSARQQRTRRPHPSNVPWRWPRAARVSGPSGQLSPLRRRGTATTGRTRRADRSAANRCGPPDG